MAVSPQEMASSFEASPKHCFRLYSTEKNTKKEERRMTPYTAAQKRIYRKNKRKDFLDRQKARICKTCGERLSIEGKCLFCDKEKDGKKV